MSSKMGIIVMNNISEFGNKVDGKLQQDLKKKGSLIIPIEQPRFGNGEGKVVIKDTVREKEIFILSDIGNHSCTYKMFDYVNHMSPDDHFQDIKRVIAAAGGNAARITLISPLLYSSRQHKRKGRESLDCALSLQDLQMLGVKTIVTFDAHDPSVQNAIPLLSFENFYPTYLMLNQFIDNEDIDFRKLIVISPDGGAFERANYYADVLKSGVGSFNKRRDFSVIVDGKNPIIAHEYMGGDIAGKSAIVVDDMVASGQSILEVVEELKKRGADKVYVFSTFSLFTKGTAAFDEAYEKGYITKYYSTNLSYVPESIISKDWFVQVDCADFVAQIIATLYKKQSLSPLLNGKEKILNKVNKHYQR